MVIFHSSVSLPEGKDGPKDDKDVVSSLPPPFIPGLRVSYKLGKW